MLLLKLALRNIMRHKRRTLLTAGVISVAVLLYISLDSHLGSMNQISYENLIDFETGHIQIVKKAYWEEKDELPLENLIQMDGNIAKAVKSAPGYAAMAGQLDFPVRLNDGLDELPVIGRALDPASVKEVFSLENYFVEGKLFKKGENKIVMGKSLAEVMELRTGDYITLLVRTKRDYFNTIEAEISGLFHTPNPGINQNIVYLSLDVARNTLSTPASVSRIVVRLADRRQAPQAAENIRQTLAASPELKIIPWQEQEAVAVMQAKQAGNSLLMGIILFIAAIGIVNTVILSALERMRETGMMKAMGLEERKIVSVFVIESTGIGVLGALAGCLLGAVSVSLLAKYGIDYSGFCDGSLGEYGIPVIGAIYGTRNLKTFIFVFLFSTAVSFFASILPSYWAARKDPVEALYER
ncbi:MAG: FtsX-like permease family protein [Elusimicrobiota bacterium]|nr:FtsX-like permease family protein [Elusimicrobiota bacterium]